MLGPWAFTITLSSERSCFFIKMGYYCFLLWKVRLHYLMELTRQDGRMFQGTRERDAFVGGEDTGSHYVALAVLKHFISTRLSSNSQSHLFSKLTATMDASELSILCLAS